jgi:DNA polymerase-1
MDKSKFTSTQPLLIIDGYNFLFRAYHVQPPLTSENGIPTGAIYGFTSMLIKLINDFKPNYAVIVLDHKGKNFRHNIYKAYKANRPTPSNELITQLQLIKPTATAFNFTTICKKGFEADDLIATITAKTTLLKHTAIIASSDKDLMQLVNDYTKMYDCNKSKFVTDTDIINKFGVPPSKVREIQALTGDRTDNIPGIPGFGPKTALQLINKFDNVQNLFASIDQVDNTRQQILLRKYKTEALISWALVGLDNNVDINTNIETFYWKLPPKEQIINFLDKYGFQSLHNRINKLFQLNNNKETLQTAYTPSYTTQIIKVQTFEQLTVLIQKIHSLGYCSVGYSNITKPYLTIAISVEQDIYLIPYQTQTSVTSNNTLNHTINRKKQLRLNIYIHNLFADTSIKKITYDLKKLLKVCNCTFSSFEDLQIMYYILYTGKQNSTLTNIIKYHSKHSNSDNKTESNTLVKYFYECYITLEQDLINNKTLHLYRNIDLPLCQVLNRMENSGIKINIPHLIELSHTFTMQIADLTKQIYNLAGQHFNISSPKQLGELLFVKLQLPFPGTINKSKTYSTNSAILTNLSTQGYKITTMILKYRHLTKLKKHIYRRPSKTS